MSSLKQKTIKGVFWSAVDSFATQGLTFVIGIILARLLTPAEFGLVGMMTVFISLSQVFIDSGFSQALIRKTDCTEADYSTVFYFNLLMGVLLYLILFFSASAIGSFFKEPQLKDLIRVLALVLIINSLTLIQRTTLTKQINFKLQTKISLVAVTLSGIVGITLALTGMGVWSLVFKTITLNATTSFLLWKWNRWKPSAVFSKSSFKELFSFGSNLLIGSLVYQLYRNLNMLVIGKFFSASELGYYTRAEQFANLPSKNVSTIVQRVSYPTLATLQHDIDALRKAYVRITGVTFLVSFALLAGLFSTAKHVILLTIGTQWVDSILYLQLLCFAVLFFPLHEINVNLLKVFGKSGLILRLEIFEKILLIPVVIIGVLYGVKYLIIGMIVQSAIAFYINVFYVGKNLNYNIGNLIRDIFPSLVMGISMAGIVILIDFVTDLSPLLTFVIQVLVGALAAIGVSEVQQNQDYLYIKKIILDKLRNANH